MHTNAGKDRNEHTNLTREHACSGVHYSAYMDDAVVPVLAKQRPSPKRRVAAAEHQSSVSRRPGALVTADDAIQPSFPSSL